MRRRVAVRAEILDGDVPLEAVERRLLELRERYRVQEIATDRGAFLRSAELLAARAMPVVKTPHSPERSDSEVIRFVLAAAAELLAGIIAEE